MKSPLRLIACAALGVALPALAQVDEQDTFFPNSHDLLYGTMLPSEALGFRGEVARTAPDASEPGDVRPVPADEARRMEYAAAERCAVSRSCAATIEPR